MCVKHDMNKMEGCKLFNNLIVDNSYTNYDYENLPSIMYGDDTIENLKINI